MTRLALFGGIYSNYLALESALADAQKRGAEKIYCLAHGQLLAEGKPQQIQNDQRVIDAYLGAH